MVTNVNQDAEISQEICSQDGMFDICNDEDPPKSPTQPDVQCDRAFSEHCDGCVVHRLQCERIWPSVSLSWRRGYHTDFRTCVNQESRAGVCVGDVEEATGRLAGNTRHR